MNISKTTMVFEVAASKLDSLILFLKSVVLRDRFWALRVGVIVQLFGLFVSFPSYDLYIFPNQLVLKNWGALNNQFLHPLTALPFAPNEHYGQIGMRLTLPIISYLLHLRVSFWLAFQPFLGMAFMGILAKEVEKLCSSRLVAFVLCLGLAATYVGKSFWVDVIGYFDGYGFFLLLVACVNRNPFALISLIVAACFVDERSYVVLPLVALYQLVRYEPFNFRASFIVKKVWPFAVAIMVSLCIRYFVGHHFHLFPPTEYSESVGLNVIRENYKSIPILYLGALDAYWLCFVYLGAALWLIRQRALSVLFALYSVVAIGVILIVLDVTRAGAYFFPVVLCFIAVLYRQEQRKNANATLATLTGMALFIPPIFSVGNTHIWMDPALPEIIKLGYKILTGHKL